MAPLAFYLSSVPTLCLLLTISMYSANSYCREGYLYFLVYFVLSLSLFIFFGNWFLDLEIKLQHSYN